MVHGTLHYRANLVGVFRKITGSALGLLRLPGLPTVVELGLGQLYIDRALCRIELDDIAILQQGDRTTDRRLGTNMPNAEATRRTGKATVGDERNLAPHALAIERRRRRQHLAHAGTALGPLVADDEHVAFFVFF